MNTTDLALALRVLQKTFITPLIQALLKAMAIMTIVDIELRH